MLEKYDHSGARSCRITEQNTTRSRINTDLHTRGPFNPGLLPGPTSWLRQENYDTHQKPEKAPSEEAKQLWKPDADVAKRLILSGSEFKVTMNNTLGDLMGKTQAARTNGYARQRNGN